MRLKRKKGHKNRKRKFGEKKRSSRNYKKIKEGNGHIHSKYIVYIYDTIK